MWTEKTLIVIVRVEDGRNGLLKEATAINNINHNITDILETTGIDPQPQGWL